MNRVPPHATSTPDRTRRVVRRLFLTVAVALVAQAVYAYGLQEPYPSFVFPSFMGAPDQGHTVRVMRPRVVLHLADSNRVIELDHDHLLAPAPGHVADAIAYTVLAPPSSDARVRTVPGQFRLFLEQPGFERGESAPAAELRDPRTIAWLGRRLSQLYPAETVVSLELRWDEYRYDVDDIAVAESVTTRARIRVPLEP